MLFKNVNFLFQKCLSCYLFVILSGCSFAPVYERPLLPTAGTYPREECIQNGKNICEIICWEDFFTDPDLQQLILLALENNRDLRVAINRISEAKALYGIQWSDMFPKLDGVAPGFRTRFTGEIIPSSLSGTPTPGVSLPKPPPVFLSAYLATLSVNAWEVDFWGRLRNMTAVALENYLATAEAEHATYISLIEQVANTYLIEGELNELVKIARQTVESRKESFRIMRRRYEEGSSSKFDAIQAETLLLQAEADLTVYERQRELNWNAMVLLLGAPIPPDNNLLSQISPYFSTEICPGLPSELLYNRPDVVAAEHRLKAANANIGAARAAFFPTILLTGAYGSASNELKNLFGSGSKFWFYFPTISVPIFDWGKNLSDLGLAEARKNIAVSEYEHTIQVAFREVSDALSERAWLEEQVIIQKAFLEAQSERARLASIRYQHGSSPYLEVLEAERDKFSAEQNLVRTQRSYLASRVNLYAALGGGYCNNECFYQDEYE